MSDTKLPVGRSRGRGRGAFNREPKPGVIETTTVGETHMLGQSIPGLGNAIDKLSHAVRALPSHPANKDMRDVVDIATKIPWTKENLDEIVMVFYKRCFNDWRFSEYAAYMCNILDSSVSTDSEDKLRAQMLICMKKDNDNADNIRKTQNDRFLALISLLCQMFTKFCINGEPLQILPVPIVQLLKMSLDDSASDKELECAATQLLAIGSLLHPFLKTSQWNEMRNAAKAAIIAERGSVETKLMLIQVIEQIVSKWQRY